LELFLGSYFGVIFEIKTEKKAFVGVHLQWANNDEKKIKSLFSLKKT
jgi:hypothetical protein